MIPARTQTSACTTVLLFLWIASALWYAVFLFSPTRVGHPLAYGLLLVAECIGMTHMVGMWLTILFARRPAPSPEFLRQREALERGQRSPSVAVFVTVAGEPVEVVRTTVTAARDMAVAHRTVVLDDGSSDDVRQMARNLGVEYLCRGTNEGRKAGNVNYALARVQSEYFVILDSDFVPAREFLLETLPYLLNNPRLAFVQTPQSYGNDETFIAGGSAEIQGVFYRHVQVGKNAFNAAFCVGTNVIFRRAAVDEVGGMYQESNSEDIWTSLLLHERGWDSFYTPQVLAVGRSPETVDAYLRQQFRWARGGFEIFFGRNPLLSSGLSLDQKIQYFLTTSHYLHSVSIFIYFLLPLLYVYAGLKPIDTVEGASMWAMHFVPYFLSVFGGSAYLAGRMLSWRSLVVSIAAFPSHIMAMLSVLTGLDLRWSVTGEIRRSVDYVQSVIPQICMLLLSLGAIPLLFLQSRPGDAGVHLIMAFWLACNSVLLVSVCKRALPAFDRAPVLLSSLSVRDAL